MHNKEAQTISVRHYCISVAPSGLTKGVKALVEGKKLPDLSKYTDIADYIEKSGMASESEGEDAAASRVTLGQDLGRTNVAQRKSRVKLHEVCSRHQYPCAPLHASESICRTGTHLALVTGLFT